MHLRKVEMVGFKSFADRTELSFDGGITAIVGPNGCGKSNVVDAVRWVLGEQSAKSLRAGSMGDVIFGGTTTRKPMGAAEVTLVFDNSSRRLPIEYDEVAVTRRLYGSGESEYLINRKTCRLRDIRELFMGTGVGTTAYSIIEQGEISRIVSSDPKELRAVFDEAAGICLYKTRLRAAAAKLERVSQNLLRANDILAEVEKRLRSVQYQAAKARRYREYSARLKHLKLDRARRLFAELSARREDLARALETRRAEAEALERSLAGAEAAGDAVTAALAALEEETGRHSAALSALDSEVANLRHTIDLCGERIERHAADENRLAAQVEARKAELEGFETRAVDLEARVMRIQRRSARLSRFAASASEEERGLAEKERSLGVELTTAENSAVEVLRATARLDNRLSELAAGRRMAIQQKERLAARENELRSAADALAAERVALVCEKGRLSADASAKRDELASLKSARLASEGRRGELDASLSAAAQRLAGERSRRELLEDLQRRREGVSDAARGVLEMGLPGTRGLVAELLDVPADLARAVEGLIGEDAAAIVVDSTGAAVAAVRALAETNGGRAKVISLERAAARPRPVRDLAVAGLRRVGDSVSARPGCEALVQALFGDVAAAESLEAALAANGETAGMRLVTYAGEVVGPDASVTGGGEAKAGGLIWRKAEIERLAGVEDRMRAEMGQIEAARDEVASGIARISERESETAAAASAIAASMAQVDGAVTAADRRAGEIAREIGVVESEIASLAGELAGADTEREAVEARIGESRHSAGAIELRVAALKDQRAETLERRERVRAHVTRVKVTLASALEKQASLERQYSEAREALEERAAAVESALRDIAAARAASARERETLDAATARLAEAGREANCARIVLAARVRDARGLREEAARLAPAIRELRATLDVARREVSDITVEEREVSVRLSETVSRAREEMGAATEELAAAAEPAGEGEAIEAEIEDLSRKLGSMGGVNFEALDELDELQARQEFLSGQRDDLVKAQEQLESIISRTRAASRKMFIESFEAVRENFASTFRRLFGGGRADCILVDPQDVLESPIEIMAKPPGKELSNLNLLSGGEKAMTAVALLFAMFATRPSPFLILDEVDAPLDESNHRALHRRHARVLPTSQFVVITHNRRTMAAADTLYGITMEERGVSRKVSVSFRDLAGEEEPAEVAAV